jgi:hypothetical protein
MGTGSSSVAAEQGPTQPKAPRSLGASTTQPAKQVSRVASIRRSKTVKPGAGSGKLLLKPTGVQRWQSAFQKVSTALVRCTALPHCCCCPSYKHNTHPAPPHACALACSHTHMHAQWNGVAVQFSGWFGLLGFERDTQFELQHSEFACTNHESVPRDRNHVPVTWLNPRDAILLHLSFTCRPLRSTR